MSLIAIHKLLRRTLQDLDFRSAMQRDPAAASASFALTPTEREALLAGDVAKLYEMGVHPFLLSYLTRYEICGLTAEVYSERIRKAHDRQ